MNTTDDLRDLITNVLIRSEVAEHSHTDELIILRDELVSTLTQTFNWSRATTD